MLRNNADAHISSLGYLWFYQSQLGDLYEHSRYNFGASGYRKCSNAKQAVHRKSVRLWMSEENFQRVEYRELHYTDYIIYPKL